MATTPGIVEEFEGCELADLRLLDRLVKTAALLDRQPDKGLPEALGGRAELEGAYRLFNSSRLELDDVLAGHVEQAIERAASQQVVLAIHDTSEFRFRGQSTRSGLGIVDQAGQGFFGHFCLLVSREEHQPLGVVDIETWTRPSKKGKRSTFERRKESGLESDRWLRQSRQVDELLPTHPCVIHVEDREGDIYESLAARLGSKTKFIVRAGAQRVVKVDDGVQNVLDHVREQPEQFRREVDLSPRFPAIRTKKSHPVRSERHARLAVCATSITLRRPKYADKQLPAELRLNAVYVAERQAPAGEPPVEWLLFTSEPIGTRKHIEAVIDSYRARWTIEEFFKALKTGCAYEARQLESYQALQLALGIFAVIAWRMLHLRFLERSAGATSAGPYARRAELEVLKAKRLTRSLSPSVTEFLQAVAALGGHIKNNGPPGILVLWRGLTKLRDLADGWALKSDQS